MRAWADDMLDSQACTLLNDAMTAPFPNSFDCNFATISDGDRDRTVDYSFQSVDPKIVLLRTLSVFAMTK